MLCSSLLDPEEEPLEVYAQEGDPLLSPCLIIMLYVLCSQGGAHKHWHLLKGELPCSRQGFACLGCLCYDADSTWAAAADVQDEALNLLALCDEEGVLCCCVICWMHQGLGSLCVLQCMHSLHLAQAGRRLGLCATLSP